MAESVEVGEFRGGNPVVFSIMEDPRPGLYEGHCAFCGWSPMTALSFDAVIATMAEHVHDVHGVVEP